jgi:hypothetical protein
MMDPLLAETIIRLGAYLRLQRLPKSRRLNHPLFSNLRAIKQLRFIAKPSLYI